jgi:hypothetical protein
VDAIAAGFPCVGFSAAGFNRGFADRQSGLFFDMLRVIDAARPRLLFLENVPGILRSGMKHVVAELCERRGFSLRWCTLSACHVGSPQLRKRWYCVGYKRESDLPDPKEFDRRRRRSWAREPVRMTLAPGPADERRMRLLGNAVVPDAARAAFRHLCCVATSAAGPSARWPQAGHIAPGSRVSTIPTLAADCVHTPIRLDPGAFEATKPRAAHASSELLRRPVEKRTWATPVVAVVQPANYLSRRADHSLPTQLRFESRTPDALRAGSPSPGWIEWIMGFPAGWTRFTRGRRT